ncbi:MAG: glycosyltransferase [Clostridiaceae bacterium]|nr:glycosyltransferase [Clostridiaceae bacterium]
MPEISVVMPVYNGEKFLPEAIESILNQSFRDFEFIVVCEYGSSQESVDIVERYAAEDSRIVSVYNNEKLGISASLNVGMEKASGKYIARMDADDISGLRRFEVQKLFLDTYPEIGVLGTSHTVIDSPNWLVDYVTDSDLINSELLFFVPLRHPTIMFSRKCIEDCKYDESLMGAEDYDFFYRLNKKTKMSNILDQSLFYYRRTGDNASEVYSVRDAFIRKKLQNRIYSEQLHLDFDEEQMKVLNLLAHDAYDSLPSKEYVSVFLELETLLQQIEAQNNELGVYKPDCMAQTLSHRWYREKYKLDLLLKKKIPNDILSVWRGSKYYSQWF